MKMTKIDYEYQRLREGIDGIIVYKHLEKEMENCE